MKDLIPWSRFLIDNLIEIQLVKIFSLFALESHRFTQTGHWTESRKF